MAQDFKPRQQVDTALDTRIIEWGGNEDAIQAARMVACKERRARWGDDCDGDGSCAECTHDVAPLFETEASKDRRRKARELLAHAKARGDS